MASVTHHPCVNTSTPGAPSSTPTRSVWIREARGPRITWGRPRAEPSSSDPWTSGNRCRGRATRRPAAKAPSAPAEPRTTRRTPRITRITAGRIRPARCPASQELSHGKQVRQAGLDLDVAGEVGGEQVLVAVDHLHQVVARGAHPDVGVLGRAGVELVEPTVGQ